jgi:uncharacterized protein YbbC (DUF1343 family)
MDARDDLGRHGTDVDRAFAQPQGRRGGDRVSGRGPAVGHERVRGTGHDTPFLLLGAPWAKGADLVAAAATPGFTLEAATFTPQASEAAPDPVHKGVECSGVRVHVADAKAAQPYKLGVALLRALRGQAGFEWRDGGAALDRLVGTKKLREAIERGDTVDAIVEADAAAIEAFKAQRKPALLY